MAMDSVVGHVIVIVVDEERRSVGRIVVCRIVVSVEVCVGVVEDSEIEVVFSDKAELGVI